MWSKKYIWAVVIRAVLLLALAVWTYFPVALVNSCLWRPRFPTVSDIVATTLGMQYHEVADSIGKPNSTTGSGYTRPI